MEDPENTKVRFSKNVSYTNVPTSKLQLPLSNLHFMHFTRNTKGEKY